jgi:hypothetical protein
MASSVRNTAPVALPASPPVSWHWVVRLYAGIALLILLVNTSLWTLIAMMYIRNAFVP